MKHFLLYTFVTITIALLSCTKVHKTRPQKDATTVDDDLRKRESTFYGFKMKKLDGSVLDFQTLKVQPIFKISIRNNHS